MLSRSDDRRECPILMPKRSLLAWLDKGNQRAMDYARAQPDLGTKTLPYAKSDSARRIGAGLAVMVALTAFLFGWVGGVIAIVVAAPLFWRLEHHFFLTRSPDTDTPRTKGSGAA